MKLYHLLLINLLLTTSLSAQERTGLVREQNSNKRPIAGVQVVFTDAVPTTSDNNGVFTLSFSGKQEGDLVFYEEIRKKGYEIVNEKELEVLKIGRTSQLSIDIILAKAGLVDAAKREYYQISDDALIAGLNKEKRALRSKLEAAQLGKQEYLDQLTALQEQYDIQKESLDALATKFARINFDDVEPFYQEALELFKAGKVSEAITTLESADPAEQTRKIIEEEKRLSAGQADLAARKVELATQKEKQIATVRLLADMYNVNFNPAKAEDQYDQLLLLDGTNLDILLEAADFYRVHHRYEKAKDIYLKIIAHPAAEGWQVTNAYGRLGDLYDNTGEYAKALEMYKSFFRSCQAQHLAAPSFYFKDGLAQANRKLGRIHMVLGDLDEALTFYQQYNVLEKELYESSPNIIRFKDGLALSYEELGELHAALGDLDRALSCHQKSEILSKELYEAYPNDMKLKNGLAFSYQSLGRTHAALGNWDQALTFFQQFNVLEKELYDSSPNDIEFKHFLAASYSYIGSIHAALGDLDRALTSYQQYNILEKELYASYPNNVGFKFRLAFSYFKLGEIHSALGNIDQALTFYLQFNVTAKELYESSPNSTEFKDGLALSYATIGVYYDEQLNDKIKAKTNFEAGEILWEELVRDVPQNAQYRQSLGSVQSQIKALEDDAIRAINKQISQTTDELSLYQLYGRLCDELRLKAKSDHSYHNNLAQALHFRGWYGFFAQEFAVAEQVIREGMALGTDINKYLATNLPPALLLQGKYEEALALYLEYKNREYGVRGRATYGVVFLEDLQAFEDAGVIPSERMEDVATVRLILRR